LFLRIIRASIVNRGRGFWLFFIMLVNRFIWIWLRGTFPRHRYDLVIYLTWKSILPFVGNLLLFFLLINVVLYF
jgi:NADH:ubiquinone oxidoreductase subunit H